MEPTGLPIVLLGLPAIGSLLLVGSAWLFARLYTRPRRRLPTTTPADHGLPFLPVTFASQGAPIRGWFIPALRSSTPNAILIVAHGWSSNASELLPVARELHEAGFALLLYDARGHGVSGGDGPITIRTFAEDLLAAIDHLQGRAEGAGARLGIVGHSIGGAAAILVASRDTRIHAVISTSAFADPTALTREVMRALHLPRGPFLWLVCKFIERWLGTTMDKVSPQNRIGGLTIPVLLIHGREDRFVAASNLDTLYARANRGFTRRWSVPGRRHQDVNSDPQYAPRVVAFLRESLAGTIGMSVACARAVVPPPIGAVTVQEVS